MTVASTTSKVSYAGDGATTTFTVPFYFLDQTHIKVTYRVNATATETVKTLTTDYTVSGAGVAAGGSITTTSAPAAGITVVIQRNVPLTQETSYQPNDPFPAKTHEAALDKLTMETQQLNEAIARSIKISTTNTMTSTEFTVGATDRALKVLGFDAAGELAVTQELGSYKGNWASGTAYKQRDLIKDTSNNNIYICVTAHTSSGSQPISTNTDAAKWSLIVDAASATSSASAAASSASAASSSASAAASSASSASSSASSASTSASTATTQASNASTSASSAATSATNASNSATAASASAAAAAASAASGLYRQVLDKSANYTIVSADGGTLFRANTGAGALTFTLPQISTITDGFKVAVVKWTSDANQVTISRTGTDTINGATSVQIGSQYSQVILVADFETNTWFASQSGLGATNRNVDVFSGNGSTTAFTLSADPGSKFNCDVFVGGVHQDHANFSTSGTTLTFTTAPPTGTTNIQVIYGTPLPIGTPSDGTVTDAKLTATGVTAGTYGSATAVAQVTVNTQGRVTGASEITIAGVPSGSVMPYAGSAAPSGWLLCYGQAVSRTTYAALFTLLSTTYGAGDGSTTFNLPDLRGRAPHGVDNMGGTAANRVTSGGSGITGTTLGAVGGTETHTLTTPQMPAHTHSYLQNTTAAAGNICSSNYGGTPSVGSTTGSTGGGGAHQNMSPTIMLNYIIKT